MTEPDVTLTDFALALECAVFALLLWRRGPGAELRGWLVLFFASTSAASLLGAAVHGFFLDESSAGHAVLWPATLLAIGVTALCGWVVGSRLLLSERAARWVARAAWLQLGVYAGVVLFVRREFWVAIAGYLPAALLLLHAFARAPVPGLRLAAWGLALTFGAAAVQQLGVAPHPVYFNHNALYHLVQAIALLLVFLGVRGLVDAPAPWRTAACGPDASS